MKFSSGLKACIVVLLIIALPGYGQATEPVGWAAVDGGTTGGSGGSIITASNAAELLKAAKREGPAIIQLVGTIRLAAPLRLKSNTTLIGLKRGATIIGGGVQLAQVNNVIIRNIAISRAMDAINISGSHHIWVDHCDLSDCKDGLVDINHGSDYLTVSWNHFYDHDKTSLVGHSDTPQARRIDAGHLRVTYHHNFFDGTGSRHPRVRYGETVHVFNNYFRGNDHGVNAVMGSGVLVEGNYFESVRYPTETAFGISPEPGQLVERDNIYVKSGKPITRGTVAELPIAYAYTRDDAQAVPQVVRHGAGCGRLSTNEVVMVVLEKASNR